MNKINVMLTEIISMLDTQFGPETTTKGLIQKCHDPVKYILAKNPNDFPLILVAYSGNNFDVKLYPGKTTFSLYFMDIKDKDDSLLDLMESVFTYLNSNPVKTYKDEAKTQIKTGNKMILYDQNLYAENNDQVIYVQKYNLLIP